ncbi:uncharacterized protein LOC132829685 [Hemiscyllium ocellatum]|uniref:uncharacterized protein LOC132829685 n=1 Tax=Hemiscyllium ocellatum TaxID=170820 RepID=UPI0029670770|nr:uncharacterized protein LOC132829685 [Hemiscyllium ocellatum]
MQPRARGKVEGTKSWPFMVEKLIIMKILVVTLVLFLAKGMVARAFPVESDTGPTHGEILLTDINFANTSMNIHDPSPILKELAQNMTLLSKEIQQQMQTLSINLHDQTNMVRETLSSLLERRPDFPEGITQHLENLKENFNQFNLNFTTVPLKQISGEGVYQEFTQNMDHIQQLFGSLVQLFHGKFAEGVDTVRESVAPAAYGIKRLVELSKAAKPSAETPELS